MLLHDAQYSADEYLSRKGWGHSSMEDAAHFASFARVKHLLLSHHDPARTDTKLNELFTHFLGDKQHAFRVELAREGMELTL